MCDTCRSDEEAKVQRVVDLAPALDHRFAQLAVVPPAASGETVQVSEPGDASERDADRMAKQALSGEGGAVGERAAAAGAGDR